VRQRHWVAAHWTGPRGVGRVRKNNRYMNIGPNQVVRVPQSTTWLGLKLIWILTTATRRTLSGFRVRAKWVQVGFQSSRSGFMPGLNFHSSIHLSLHHMGKARMTSESKRWELESMRRPTKTNLGQSRVYWLLCKIGKRCFILYYGWIND
jgi:hypothetical protein